jgi:hypothetical protein
MNLNYFIITLISIISITSLIECRPQFPNGGYGQGFSQNLNAGPVRVGVAESTGIGYGPTGAGAGFGAGVSVEGMKFSF